MCKIIKHEEDLLIAGFLKLNYITVYGKVF